MVILTSFAPPEEGIRHKQESTSAHVEGQVLGDGALYIAESRVSWMSSEGRGFSLEYPAISLHAISRDVNTFPQECLYLMVDGKLSDDTERISNGSEESDDNEEEENPTSEIRFIPCDKGALDAMYIAMSECQALHPDEEDTDSEAEEEVIFYGEEDAADQLTPEGQVTLQHLDTLLQEGQGDGQAVDDEVDIEVERPGGLPVEQNGHEDMETGQFDDADMQQ